MEKPENAILVIFGASGDLTRRKLFPALFSLEAQDILPERYSIIGVGRTEMSDHEFRDIIKESIVKYSKGKNGSDKQLEKFTGRLSYNQIDYDSVQDYAKLKGKLSKLDELIQTGKNLIFHLALPPSLFEVVARNIDHSDLNSWSKGYRRLIIEKPFGYDLETGINLNISLLKAFSEDQIYRIDHYLGKEAVQNLLVTRFANGIFEPLWNSRYINHVEITSAENIGVENRGGYYDTSGALRDMVQNHLLQMVGITAMEPPSSMDANSIRNEILKVLQALRPIKQEEVGEFVVRGQYTESKIQGKKVDGYRQENGVDTNSKTETFVAMKFFIDNWRWGGVPFYIRTGKRLPTRVTEIVIHFKPTPHFLFSRDEAGESSNKLVIRIQPDEGILLKFGMKLPGAGFNVKDVNMDFHYKDLANIRIPDAYERLLYDAFSGDSTLFARGDAVEAAWRFINPIQKAWAQDSKVKILGYTAGTWGPVEADNLIEGDGITWRYPCKNLTNDGIYCEL